MMARPRSVLGALLLAGMMITSGCISIVPSQVEPSRASTAANLPTAHGEDRADPGDPAPAIGRVHLELALTEASTRVLKVQGIDVETTPVYEGRVLTNPARLMPGQTVRIGQLQADAGTQVETIRLKIAFFDGLGPSNLTLRMEDIRFSGEATETITLRSQGPGQIGFVDAEGPFETTAPSSHAKPQYGYLQWPDGHRRPLAGFEHVIQVPTSFPDVPAGKEVTFLAEAPARTPVLWRVDDREPLTSHTLTFAPDPGVHRVRVSIGPGEDSTELLVRTDRQETVNGTLPAATPEIEERVDPVNSAQHALPVDEAAQWVRLDLRSADLGEVPRDLDLKLLDEAGTEIASSEHQGSTHEQLIVHHPRASGNLTVQVDAEAGAALNYTLSMRVHY